MGFNYLIRQPPEVTITTGYCQKCPADNRLRACTRRSNWAKHVRSEHALPVQYICTYCALVIDRQSRLENHFCTVMLKKLDKATNVHQYRVLPHGSKWLKDLNSKDPVDLADIANEQGIIVPSKLS